MPRPSQCQAGPRHREAVPSQVYAKDRRALTQGYEIAADAAVDSFMTQLARKTAP